MKRHDQKQLGMLLTGYSLSLGKIRQELEAETTKEHMITGVSLDSCLVTYLVHSRSTAPMGGTIHSGLDALIK